MDSALVDRKRFMLTINKKGETIHDTTHKNMWGLLVFSVFTSLFLTTNIQVLYAEEALSETPIELVSEVTLAEEADEYVEETMTVTEDESADEISSEDEVIDDKEKEKEANAPPQETNILETSSVKSISHLGINWDQIDALKAEEVIEDLPRRCKGPMGSKTRIWTKHFYGWSHFRFWRH